MLDEHEVATLERLVRRMTDKQRGGLEMWLNASNCIDGKYLGDGPLWAHVKEAQEYVHWYEVADGEPWGTPEEETALPAAALNANQIEAIRW